MPLLISNEANCKAVILFRSQTLSSICLFVCLRVDLEASIEFDRVLEKNKQTKNSTESLEHLRQISED